MLEDADGSLWIGTEGGGLDRVRDGDVVPFGAAQGATDKLTWSVREDPTGAIWIGSYEGLFRIPPGQTTATKIVSDHETMMAIYPDARGDVWFSARDGTIGRWHDGQFAWLGRGAFKAVRSIAETKDGMWLGTDNGLFRCHGDRVEDAESVLPGFWVTAIRPDAGGGLWLATARGVMRWSAGGLVPIPAGGPPTSTPAATIQLDPDGTLWVATEGVGLWRLRHDRWFAFTSKHGMLDDRVWSVFDDGGGRLWMSSNRGIWSVSLQQVDDLAAGLAATVDSTVYGEADGMRDRECNGAIDPSGWRTHDGRIWIPTVKGVAVIDPAHLSPIRPANALIESVRVDGQPHSHGPTLELAPGSHRLEVAYTAPAVGSAERLRFRYRLDGFEPTWNDARGQRLAQYTNLAPGGYRFMVEAAPTVSEATPPPSRSRCARATIRPAGSPRWRSRRSCSRSSPCRSCGFAGSALAPASSTSESTTPSASSGRRKPSWSKRRAWPAGPTSQRRCSTTSGTCSTASMSPPRWSRKRSSTRRRTSCPTSLR
jgi:hypothetical protein